MGDSPRRVNMWSDGIGNFKRGLSLWKRMHLSMGGIVVMIKSVLNSIPL